MSRRMISVLNVLVLGLGAAAGSAEAQVECVSLRVDGLACSFCAYGLEKKIRKLEGYESFEVFINAGKVVVGWREDKPLDLAALQNAVKKAGFTLRGIQGRLVGTITKQDGRYYLALPKPPGQRFYVYEPRKLEDMESGKRREEQATNTVLSDAYRKLLDELMTQKQAVRIVGPIHGETQADHPAAIGIQELDIALANATGLIRFDQQTGDESERLKLVEAGTNRVMNLTPGDRIDWRESYQGLMAKAKAVADRSQPLAARVYGELSDDRYLSLVMRRWEPLRYGSKVVVNVKEIACERCSVGMMRALVRLEDVIHVEADHEDDLVSIWTRSQATNDKKFHEEIESAGLKVVGIHTELSVTKEK